MMFARKLAVAVRGEVYFFHQHGIITRSNRYPRLAVRWKPKKAKKRKRKKGSRPRSRLHPTRNVCVFNELFSGSRLVPRDKCKENQIYERSIRGEKESPRSSIIAFLRASIFIVEEKYSFFVPTVKRHVLFFRRGEAKTSKERFLPTIKAGQETKGEAQESGQFNQEDGVNEPSLPLLLRSFNPPRKREGRFVRARVLN